MQKALKGTPPAESPQPPGIVAARINAESGLRDNSGTLTDYFLAEFPPRGREEGLGPDAAGAAPGKDIREQIF